MAQTAVEWLESNINDGTFCDHICGARYWDKETLLGFIEQAKQMERGQIEKAWWAGHDESGATIIYPSEDCNGYYNQTYGSNQNN